MKPKEKNGSNFQDLLWLFVLVFILWLIYLFTVRLIVGKFNVSGLFGDSFGGFTALFSGFAFVGIIYTIWQQQKQLALQMEELALQRKELELTRNELKRSAEAQEKSEKALNDQVEKLNTAARINGYSTLISFHENMIDRRKANEELVQKHSDFSSQYIETLERILKSLEH